MTSRKQLHVKAALTYNSLTSTMVVRSLRFQTFCFVSPRHSAGYVYVCPHSLSTCAMDFWAHNSHKLVTQPRGGGGGAQLPNCQTQCRFSWLVVSPLRQKSTRSGNLVLAVILAFYAVKTASLSPLATSNSALCTGAAPQASSWWAWAPAAHSLPVPSSDSTQPSVF